jgi:hypothetical protein
MAGLFQAFLVALVVTVPAPRKEGLQSFTGAYSVTFLGIPVAHSTFNSTFKGDSFSVKGVASAAGLAQLFDDTQGSVSAAGRFAGDRTQPTAFRVDYTEGRKAKMTSIRFKAGSVARTENVPPLKKRGKDWVPVSNAHLRTVTDPLSATLVRADSLAEVCGRTINIYDGELRFDLTLTHQSTGAMAIDGWEGETVTCNVRFKPVAGYRKGRRALDYLKNRSRMTITFAPLGATGVYGPVRATVGTQIGTITVQAQRLEATK